MNADKEYTVIDLFAGCGGLSLGFFLAGWKGLFAIEKSPLAFETLKYNLMDNHNHFDWPTWLPKTPHEIDEVISNYKKELIGLQGQVDLVAGGPPCQGFSMAGKRVKADVRNKLAFSYIDFIKLVQPRMILFENVKGFTYAFDKTKDSNAVPYSDIVIQKLKEQGYNLKAQIIDFSNYGVPQRRKRFILIGTKDGNAEDFERIMSQKKIEFLKDKKIPEFNTLEAAISDLLMFFGKNSTPDRKGFTSGVYGTITSEYQKLMRTGQSRTKNGHVVDSHSFAKHNKETISCFNNLIINYPTKGKRIANKERAEWNIKKRGLVILNPKTVSPTLTSHPDDYVHYSEPRILTVREYARIQSFPDWYEIKGKYTTGGKLRKIEVPRYTQIGNAIPPLFAELAGITLKEL